jgi:EAL domain-containing protein (putative c-di-GMP-specific phosphodiesterase class I)/ActR/RegA family two-component response regulator
MGGRLVAFVQVVSMTDESARILLVAHNVAESAALANALSNSGFEIVTCREIEAAEALLLRMDVQVVITDLSFPPLFGVEGIKLIQHLKARFPNMMTIGLAHKSDSQLDQLFCAAKGSKLLAKPANAQEILNFIAPRPARVPGRVQHISRLEDFLKTRSIASLLQPIIGIRKDNDGQILGVESLARAQTNPGLWNPEMLFDYAERVEKTYETDLLCIESALAEASGLATNMRLFINVRPRSIARSHFAAELMTLTHKFGFKSEQIAIELTEQQTIANLEEFNRALTELRTLGFGFALDDFGAGYANLEWLQSLKPDYLKLSGVFSRNLDSDMSKQVIVRAATQMARRLSIPTILENVETAGELEKARAIGIDYAQGYYFFQPKSAKNLKELIPGFQHAKSLA